MNPEQHQISGLPLPQSSAPAGGYSVAKNATDLPDEESRSTAQQPVVSALPAVDLAESDESDAIDEAWVAKAREIVDRTRDDPYMQSNALARLRADYLKSKYSKDIKISEDAQKWQP